jgi:hypothetical protein
MGTDLPHVRVTSVPSANWSQDPAELLAGYGERTLVTHPPWGKGSIAASSKPIYSTCPSVSRTLYSHPFRAE